MVKKIFITASILFVVGLVLFFAIDGSANKDDGYKPVDVEVGSIIDKALAVGKIEPQQEISVKSKVPGIVRKCFVEVGDIVKKGDPLFDVAPDPTPIEYAEASRQVELNQVSYKNAERKLKRSRSLLDQSLISSQEYESKEFAFDDAELRLKLSKEKLSLIVTGRTEIADIKIDNIIRAPIGGTVLSRFVEEGDPVVPLTSYQAGTELLTLANMDNLIFRGNVDEIDVGKLHHGMAVEIEVGAISGDKISGILRRISPKAHKEEGSTLFEVEIDLDKIDLRFLRAGYSANADIIITKKVDILLVPERLVKVEDSVTTVEVEDSLGFVSTVEIETGLSDGINMEVVTGLSENDKLVERPPREIESD